MPVTDNEVSGLSLPNLGYPVNSLTYVKWGGLDNAESLSGEGSKESPYLITNGAELMYFARSVNEGNSYEGDFIRLENNLDMNINSCNFHCL